jgi:hypothetical protein
LAISIEGANVDFRYWRMLAGSLQLAPSHGFEASQFVGYFF